MGLMKKGTPTGVQDQFLRDICVGDEITDAKGRHYTINAYGYAKPLGGGTEIPLKSVKEKTVAIPWKPAEEPMLPPFGKAVKEPPIPDPEFDPAPPHPDEVEAAKKSGTKSGTKSDPVPVKGVISKRGGRSNQSGMASFWNLSRTAGCTAAELRRIAEENGFEILRSQGANRNTGIRVEDVERFRALLPGMEKSEKAPRGLTDDDIVREVEARALWLRCLKECPGFSDTLLHNTLVDRGTYSGARIAEDMVTKEPEKVFNSDPCSAEDFDNKVILQEFFRRGLHGAIVTVDPEKVFTKFDAFLILDDKDLADELRHRGFEVHAVKRIEL